MAETKAIMSSAPYVSEKAWVAGVLDAIGVFRLNWKPGTWEFTPSLTACSRNEDLIDGLCKRAGNGTVTSRIKKEREVFYWRCDNDSIVYILRSVLDYLVVKKTQCQGLLEVAEQKSKSTYASNILTHLNLLDKVPETYEEYNEIVERNYEKCKPKN